MTWCINWVQFSTLRMNRRQFYLEIKAFIFRSRPSKVKRLIVISQFDGSKPLGRFQPASTSTYNLFNYRHNLGHLIEAKTRRVESEIIHGAEMACCAIGRYNHESACGRGGTGKAVASKQCEASLSSAFHMPIMQQSSREESIPQDAGSSNSAAWERLLELINQHLKPNNMTGLSAQKSSRKTLILDGLGFLLTILAVKWTSERKGSQYLLQVLWVMSKGNHPRVVDFEAFLHVQHSKLPTSFSNGC